MSSPTSTKLDNSFWNEYFRLYDVLNKVFPYKALLASVVSEMDLKSGVTVLDAGTGTGNLAVLIARSGADVVGLDSSEIGLKIFKEKLPDHEVLLHDLQEDIPLESEKFDYICSVNTLFAIDPAHREKICREFYRLLKPNGKLVMTNLSQGYKPIRIYIAHFRGEIQRFGPVKAVINLILLLKPTFKMFYFNNRMKKEHGSMGGMRFFKSGEQKALLTSCGFINVSEEKSIFAGQAVLNTGFKV